MKRKLVSVVLAAVMVLSLTACGAAKEEAAAPAKDEPAKASAVTHDRNGDGKLVIYGIYKAGDQSWFINEGEAAKAAVEEAGGEFYYVDSKMSPEQYLNDINNAIANNADGIVTCIPDQTLSQAVVDTCKEAGIPIVAADDGLEMNGEKLVPWVGINGYNIGFANGEWINEYLASNGLADDAECGLLLMTMSTVSSCVPRTDGEYDAIMAKNPQIEKDGRLFYADYDGTTDKGNTTAAAIITGNPQIKKWIVTGANEEGTVGAVRALETASLDKDACVVGLGAYMAKDEFKKDSCMKAAAYFSELGIGRGSVEAVFDLIDGKDVPLEKAVDAIVVTPENYEEVMGDAAK